LPTKQIRIAEALLVSGAGLSSALVATIAASIGTWAWVDAYMSAAPSMAGEGWPEEMSFDRLVLSIDIDGYGW
jgi:hypothetical protein